MPEPPPLTSPVTPVATGSAPTNFEGIFDAAAAMDSRTSTMDSTTSAGAAGHMFTTSGHTDVNSSQGSLASQSRQDGGEESRDTGLTPRTNGPASAGQSPPPPSQSGPAAATAVNTPAQPPATAAHLSAPIAVDLTLSGAFAFIDSGNFRIRTVSSG